MLKPNNPQKALRTYGKKHTYSHAHLCFEFANPILLFSGNNSIFPSQHWQRCQKRENAKTLVRLLTTCLKSNSGKNCTQAFHVLLCSMLRPFRNGNPPQVRQHARNHRGRDRHDYHHRHHPGQDFKMCTVQFAVGPLSAVGLSCNGEMKVSLFLFIATITIVIVIVTIVLVRIVAVPIVIIVIVTIVIVAIIVTVTVVTRRGGLLGVRNL